MFLYLRVFPWQYQHTPAFNFIHIFNYINIYRLYLKSYHINEEPYQCIGKRVRFECDRSWVRLFIHINKEPPFVAAFEDILGKYSCRMLL